MDIATLFNHCTMSKIQILQQFPQKPHVNARRSPYLGGQERELVLDKDVPWNVLRLYRPPNHTDQCVRENARNLKTGNQWADPEYVLELREELDKRVTTSASEDGSERTLGEAVEYDEETGAPLNPRGRTGLAGRGALGKWGPNYAADPVVTRVHDGGLQMVAIQRKDTGEWAIPGGMVEQGELVSVTLKREFSEEAGNLKGRSKEQFDALVETLFKKGRQVFRGYVDDPRNSDNAWMETSVFHFHCSKELGTRLPLNAGDDAAASTWMDVDPINEPRYAALYASHRDWVDGIASTFASAATAIAKVCRGRYARARVKAALKKAKKEKNKEKKKKTSRAWHSHR